MFSEFVMLFINFAKTFFDSGKNLSTLDLPDGILLYTEALDRVLVVYGVFYSYFSGIYI